MNKPLAIPKTLLRPSQRPQTDAASRAKDLWAQEHNLEPSYDLDTPWVRDALPTISAMAGPEGALTLWRDTLSDQLVLCAELPVLDDAAMAELAKECKRYRLSCRVVDGSFRDPGFGHVVLFWERSESWDGPLMFLDPLRWLAPHFEERRQPVQPRFAAPAPWVPTAPVTCVASAGGA
jgi:hypothetical protein